MRSDTARLLTALSLFRKTSQRRLLAWDWLVNVAAFKFDRFVPLLFYPLLSELPLPYCPSSLCVNRWICMLIKTFSCHLQKRITLYLHHGELQHKAHTLSCETEGEKTKFCTYTHSVHVKFLIELAVQKFYRWGLCHRLRSQISISYKHIPLNCYLATIF